MSKIISINIENSYGILKFNHDFVFDAKSNFYSLYAQNGTMKSSFAKSLDDQSKGTAISDHLFRVDGECIVDGVDDSNILSFPSFDGRVEICDDAASLVANDEVKKAYEEAFGDVMSSYATFTDKLAQAANVTSDAVSNELVEKMYRAFVSFDAVETVTVPGVIQLLKSSLTEIKTGNTAFCEVSYGRFTHTNFKNFVKNPKYTGFFNELATAYDTFRASSTYYRKGFDASSAQKLIKELGGAKYFEAEHVVALKGKDGQIGKSITTKAELETYLKTDFDMIIEQHPNLKQPLGDLIKDFGTGTNSDVRAIFEDVTKRDLLLFMGSEDRFYKNMWYGYLASCADEVVALIVAHDAAKDKITKALDEAEDCTNEWEDIIDIFNDRFSDLPYRLSIVNKKDAIVNDLVQPVFEVKYKNPRNEGNPYAERPDAQNKLNVIGQVLSNGERKALHLINVIFRLRSKLKDGSTVLAVFDDLVESFDYKNKYAFFEYLQELSADNQHQLYVIMLTHNFDFYRLVYDKLHPRSDDQFKIITRAKDGTLDVSDMFDPRVFGSTKAKAVDNKSAWISLIPFARNIVEYKSSSSADAYLRFTQCLHVMKSVPHASIIMSDVEDYTGVSVCPLDTNKAIHDEIIDTAAVIAGETDGGFDLHNNITLAIGTRLLIERYIISKMTPSDYDEVLAKARDQTRKLIERYKNNVSDTDKAIKLKLFNKAAMMVDGSIHLNSFMYEPLIDMGTWELKDMYNETKVATS